MYGCADGRNVRGTCYYGVQSALLMIRYPITPTAVDVTLHTRCREDVRDGPPMIQLCLLLPHVRVWFVDLAWVHLLACGRNKRGAPVTRSDYRDGIGGRRGRGKGSTEHGEPLTRNQPHSECGCKSVAGRTAWVPEHPPAHPPSPRTAFSPDLDINFLAGRRPG
ncbi:hypothetical protein DFH09DRAFT_1085865 [Mycena vulgaris]|nr:hypothetical protein DFH09DRAFT_1085865 [Mycena vulgaris]